MKSATIRSMPGQTFNLMSGEEIKSHGLIADGDDSLYRASTYDLSVGEIIPAGPHAGTMAATSEYRLPPGGMVRVVSRESLRMPDDVTGHVLLKNALCRTGVLAINIGVVDPGFVGPLSSTLINFGRADFVVGKGLSFLRVSFHRSAPSPKATESMKWDRADYLARVREEVLAYSAPTFLNVEETSARAAERAFGSFKQSLVLWATLAAIVLALVTVFVPLGASYVDRYLAGRDRRETEIRQSIEKKLEDQYGARLKVLSDQVEELRRTAAARPNTGPGSGKR
jgi:dCTP deaminase-like protein